MAMTYTVLSQAVADYLETSFTSTGNYDQLNTFIAQAEQRIFNSVQLPDLRITTTLNTTASTPYVQVPADFMSVHSMAVYGPTDTAYAFLLNKDVNYIREAYPDPAYTGQPAYYALFGPSAGNTLDLAFILGPTPDQFYNLELQYFHYPQSIVTAGETWLGDNFDSALLWGTVVEAYHHLKGEADLLAAYTKRYEEAMALLKQLGDGKNRMDSYRSGQVRQGVK